MTATERQQPEYEALVVQKMAGGELAFTFGTMVFSRIPSKVLFPGSMFPDSILEVGGRLEGERILFDYRRRPALLEWFAARRAEQ